MTIKHHLLGKGRERVKKSQWDVYLWVIRLKIDFRVGRSQ